MGIREKFARYDAAARDVDAGMSVADVSEKHGINTQTVYKIIREWGLKPVRASSYFVDPERRQEIDALRSRNADILARFNAGDTLESIGQHYGITRERVRQITNAAGVEPRHIQADRKIEEDVAILSDANMTRAEAAEFTGRPLSSISRMATKRGVKFRSSYKVDAPEMVEMAAKVADGMSIYEAAGKVHNVAARLADHCKRHGIETVHGRWHDRGERRNIVLQMRSEGRAWPDIAVAVAEAESKPIGLPSLMAWAYKHVPEVIGFRLPVKMEKPVSVWKAKKRPAAITPVKEMPMVVMAPSLREGVKVNRGKASASQIAAAYGVTRNSVIGLWFRMRKNGEITE